MLWFGAGTAYRIRTGDLRLERAVSWASRRMRRGRAGDERRTGRNGSKRPGRVATDRGPAWRRLEAVRFEERADGLRDLLIALLGQDQAVVRVRSERLVAGVKPLRKPF